MEPFLWLLLMIAEAVWPFYVVAVAVLVGAAVHRRRVALAEPGPPMRVLGAVLIAPFALTVWSGVTYRPDSAGGRSWASSVLTVLAIGILLFVVWVLWTWQRRILVALPIAVAAAAATFIGWFIGAMAIGGDWV